MEPMPRMNVSRRHLLGLGAAAGAATVAGMTTHLPIASAAEGDEIGVSARQLPNYTAITKVSGLQAAMLGYADFQALGTGTGQGLRYADPPSVYNESGNSVAATLRLPVGAVLRQIDFFGFRQTGAASNLTFNLYRTSLPTSATRSTEASTTLTGNGEVQGVFTFSPGYTVAVGDVFTLEAVTAADGTNRVAGAVYQYAPTGGIYVPIAPKRVHDSRQSPGTKIAASDTVPRTFSIANEIASTGGATDVVPAGATGIAYNLTITDTDSTFGYLTVVAGGASTAGPSSINWDRRGATIANGLQGPLNSDRQISVRCGGNTDARTHFLVDILGYYL